MKSKILKSLCTTGIAATFAMASVGPAISAPVTSPGWFGNNATATLVAHRGDRHRGDGPYYGGYKGSRHHHPGYRSHNGFWFPLAAFGLGAIIGGAVANNSGGSAHVQWCYDRYRSYRVYDNSYQPYNGPRRLCYSPYG
jgi:FAD/FMN-containing dehydrogenase